LLEKLSNQEKKVVFLIVKSLKNSQIAQELNIKERTVKQHLSNIYEKLNINDRVTLALMFK
jgi:DNA-binding NarL/FixJ family response regulator